ncbi:hypothetical protein D9619_013331 [Psilocybe cf. subviscida]|uniref:Reverse transcriptase domain-containing protein n=1 Tax=Psilocybe cf. subviscida TaxID=2480587 RepID=A0A8H5BS34_9AGAR|nr:hypothetical protein D9619_013331 [Psilocybe cf. subviscida]
MDEDGGGIIVGLDQEKAYNKIAHDYLWRVLERFNFPSQFIHTVKTLYKNANTSAMINGEMSTTYKVTRGVRQGCPLSCWLFDLAIEPLAEMLRKSSLEGFKTRDMVNRIVVTLFADDTTVYLSKRDDIQILLNILKEWCTASGTKFNIAKTEIIPTGPESYRVKVVLTRKLHPGGREIPTSMNIAKEGESKRFLGAWIGNGANQEGVWAPVIEKINATLKRWEKTFPTIKGRKIILQWVVGGMTQYLTNIQGMPLAVEKQLDKICREYAWDNEGRAMVNTQTMANSLADGGKGVINVKQQNDAIVLAQIRDFLAPSNDAEKPWAPFMREILAHYAQSYPKTDPMIRDNPFLQDWNPAITKLPKNIQKMLKTAHTYGVKLEVAEVTADQARNMPVWSHLAMTPEMRKLQNAVYPTLLRQKHKIVTVGDLEETAKSRDAMPDHVETAGCTCEGCKHDRVILGCTMNPAKCTQNAKKLLSSLPDKWHPEKCEAAQKDAPALGLRDGEFPKQMACEDDIRSRFRVFTGGGNTSNTQLQRDQAPEAEHEDTQHINIYAQGAVIWLPSGYTLALGGARTDKETPQNTQTRFEEATHAESTADGAALASALTLIRRVPTEADLTIHFTSPQITKTLTTSLHEEQRTGWIGTQESRLYQAIAAALRRRAGTTIIRQGGDEQTALLT